MASKSRGGSSSAGTDDCPFFSGPCGYVFLLGTIVMIVEGVKNSNWELLCYGVLLCCFLIAALRETIFLPFFYFFSCMWAMLVFPFSSMYKFCQQRDPKINDLVEETKSKRHPETQKARLESHQIDVPSSQMTPDKVILQIAGDKRDLKLKTIVANSSSTDK